MTQSLSLRQLLFVISFCLPFTLNAQEGGPAFSKSFSPNTIGPGSSSLLTFTITNSTGTPVTNLAFVDDLPAAVTIADAPQVNSSCGDLGIISAPAGGSSINFSGGTLGANQSCTISLYVTSSEITFEGGHFNTTGDLTSSAGNSGTASAELFVESNRPGFTKNFEPPSINLGETSTLTFTIDNTANGSPATFLQFTDILPSGLVIASPSNAVTDCGASPTLTANPGSGFIDFSDSGQGVGAEGTCTVTVDVVSTGAGSLENVSSDLSTTVGTFSRSGGHASATLEVTRSELHIQKSFIDDPVVPGDTATLEFTITNFDRNFSATGITFTDDLNAVLSGLAAVGLPATDICGAGSQLSGSSLLTLTGGTLAPGASCTFSVPVQVPTMTMPGKYSNTTSMISGTVDGIGVTGNPAKADLFVAFGPRLTKTFTNNPVAPGDTAILEFKIKNTDPGNELTDIEFTDELTAFLGFPVSVILPTDPCGMGSSLTLEPCGTKCEILHLTDGILADGDSCTFLVSIVIPPGQPGGPLTNTTSEITGTVSGGTVTGAPASDDLVILYAPRLVKEFIDDPVAPGDVVELEFSISLDENATGDMTDIAFTDDLNAALAGLTAVGLPLNDVCGVGSSISGTTILSFTGGTLSPGESCSFSISAQVPAMANLGLYTNTTSNITGTIAGDTVLGNQAKDDLLVSNLIFTKEFLGNPSLPGELDTLRFTIDNTSGIMDATGISFTDNLGNNGGTLSGLAAEGLPIMPCGGTLSGTTNLAFSGGTVLAGGICVFDVPVRIPMNAANGNYINTTSDFSATIGNPITLPPATGILEINNELLSISKKFTNDPVFPGETVDLEFTIENLDPSNTITDITFTDDLDAALTGLAATGLPSMNICGAGSNLSGTSLLAFTGGSLGPGASCTFMVSLNVPMSAIPGNYLNTTSVVTGKIGAADVEGDMASDELRVRTLSLEKTIDGPAESGDTVTITFTLENLDASNPITEIAFMDDLNAMLAGSIILTVPAGMNICGAGAMVSGAGTSDFTFENGSLAPGGSCSFQITVKLPCEGASGVYQNVTSDVSSSVGTTPGAEADLMFTEVPAANISGEINGPMVICPGLKDLQYSVASSPGVTNYIWSFSDTSATIVGNGSPQVSISFNQYFVGGTLTVSVANNCGMSTKTLQISKGSAPLCELATCLSENEVLIVDNTMLNAMGALDVYQNYNKIESNALIQAMRDIIFKAGNQIILNQPFTVELGATFIAEIEVCMNAKTGE